jgi:hypothetical protein
MLRKTTIFEIKAKNRRYLLRPKVVGRQHGKTPTPPEKPRQIHKIRPDLKK